MNLTFNRIQPQSSTTDNTHPSTNCQPAGGSSDVGSTVSKLLLAACAMGFACTFSAPMGGVIFALELMSLGGMEHWKRLERREAGRDRGQDLRTMRVASTWLMHAFSIPFLGF